jgi:RNA polymerase sigma-70 factor (ECF subfamily)
MSSIAVKLVTPPPTSLEALYDAHAALVWRTLARLGVAKAQLDDAVQEVFLVAYRQLASFEGRSSHRTWLVGIALKVASTWRRTAKRLGEAEPLGLEHPDGGLAPDDAAARGEGLAVLRLLLAKLPREQQEVFVLMELEEHTALEVAEATGENVNTVYSRLRLARAAFNAAVAKWQEVVR